MHCASRACTVHILGEDHIRGPRGQLPHVDVLLVEYSVDHAETSVSNDLFGQTERSQRALDRIDAHYKKSAIQPHRFDHKTVLCDVRKACGCLRGMGLWNELRDMNHESVRDYIVTRSANLLAPNPYVQDAFRARLKVLSSDDRARFARLFHQFKEEVASLMNDDLPSCTILDPVDATRMFDSLYNDAPCKMTDLYFVVTVLALCTRHPSIGILCGMHHVPSIARLLSHFGFA